MVCSLVLEHLNHEAMTQLFERIDQKLAPRAWVYVAELHPCKQYKGSKARIAAPDGGEPQVLEAYTHHTSDYLAAARARLEAAHARRNAIRARRGTRRRASCASCG